MSAPDPPTLPPAPSQPPTHFLLSLLPHLLSSPPSLPLPPQSLSTLLSNRHQFLPPTSPASYLSHTSDERVISLLAGLISTDDVADAPGGWRVEGAEGVSCWVRLGAEGLRAVLVEQEAGEEEGERDWKFHGLDVARGEEVEDGWFTTREAALDAFLSSVGRPPPENEAQAADDFWGGYGSDEGTSGPSEDRPIPPPDQEDPADYYTRQALYHSTSLDSPPSSSPPPAPPKPIPIPPSPSKPTCLEPALALSATASGPDTFADRPPVRRKPPTPSPTRFEEAGLGGGEIESAARDALRGVWGLWKAGRRARGVRASDEVGGTDEEEFLELVLSVLAEGQDLTI